MNNQKMPLLEPVPIKTKNRNFFVMFFVWITSRRKWIIRKNFHFKLYDGTEIVIPEGFVFDGASIPRFFWFFLSPVGLLFLPGLIHDFAYRYDGLKTPGLPGWYVPGAGRFFWDKLFRRTNIQVNGFVVISWIAFIALVLFGWLGWFSKVNRSQRKTARKGRQK